MNKPWFGRKKIGWGYGLPIRTEGWLVLVLYIASLVCTLTFLVNRRLVFLSIFLLTIIFILIVAKTSGKPQWGTLWDIKTNKRVTMITGIFIVIIIFIFVIPKISLLRKAHSSFYNYYQFRGCVQLLEKTDTYGICKVSSGQTIKLINVGGKWYLDGDGPGIF